MKTQPKSTLTQFTTHLSTIYLYLSTIIDSNKIDTHSSLTFLNKHFHKKPSQIAKIIIYLVLYLILTIQGIRIIIILMCYLLPIGILILKLCQLLKTKKKKSHLIRIKSKVTEIEEEQNISISQKNQSQLSINSRHNQHDKSSSHPDNDKKTPNSNSKPQSQNIASQQKINQLSKIFIFYFALNLIVELCEPILLLIIQTLFSLALVGFESIQQSFITGNFWTLILLPFSLISTFFIQIFSFSKPSTPAVITLLILRVLLSAFLLNLKPEHNNYCTKLLFEQKFQCPSPELPKEQKPKKQ